MLPDEMAERLNPVQLQELQAFFAIEREVHDKQIAKQEAESARARRR